MFTVEQLLSIAKEKKASDVHVTVGLPPRVRINGELVDLDYPKLSPDDCEKLILDIIGIHESKIWDSVVLVVAETEENLIFHSLFLILDDTELMYSDREGLWHVPCVL